MLFHVLAFGFAVYTAIDQASYEIGIPTPPRQLNRGWPKGYPYEQRVHFTCAHPTNRGWPKVIAGEEALRCFN